MANRTAAGLAVAAWVAMGLGVALFWQQARCIEGAAAHAGAARRLIEEQSREASAAVFVAPDRSSSDASIRASIEARDDLERGAAWSGGGAFGLFMLAAACVGGLLRCTRRGSILPAPGE